MKSKEPGREAVNPEAVSPAVSPEVAGRWCRLKRGLRRPAGGWPLWLVGGCWLLWLTCGRWESQERPWQGVDPWKLDGVALLARAKWGAEAQTREIELTSSPGQGTEFVLVFPKQAESRGGMS